MEDKKILEAEKPETKKEVKSESSLKQEEVKASPLQPENTKPEVSISDLEKLYKVIEKQNQKLEQLTKEKEVKKEVKKTERPTNVIESSESQKDKIDNSKIFNGVFVK